MSDDPGAASFLDRVNTLSAPAVAGLGAAAGLLLAAVSALSVEPSSSENAAGSPESSPPVSAAAAAEDASNGGAPRPGSTTAGRQEQSGADPRDPPPPTEPVRSETDIGATNDGTVSRNPDALEDEPHDVAHLAPDVGSPTDASADAAPDPSEQAGSPTPSPAGRTKSDRDAEAKMSADELLTAAAGAYEEKRFKDAYRLATRSQRARPTDRAQMLRGRSACHLRDEKNAREIVRSFKLGDKHRKTLRTFCKDRGVRVGL